MAEINNAEAVRFCNERIRIAANKLNDAYRFAKAVEAEYYANNMGTLFVADEGPVVDGSASDGRHPIGANEVLLMITRLTEIVTDYEANTNLKLNTILAVATNE